LELICPFNQAKNRSNTLPGQNPAKGRIEVCLDNLSSFKFCQTLGHESASKYLLNHGPKVEKRDQHNQVLSSQRRKEIPFTRVMIKPAATSSLGFATCPLAELMSNLVVLRYFVT